MAANADVRALKARIRELDELQARNEAITARIREIREHPDTTSKAELDAIEAEVVQMRDLVATSSKQKRG